MKKTILVGALLASLPMLSLAETSLGDHQAIGAKISTLGLGLDYSFAVAESFDGRVGFSKYSRSINRTWGDYPAHGEIDLSTVNLLVDWFPANNSLRVTAGLMINNNKVDLNKTVLSGAIQEYGHVDFRKLSPYLGIGWTGRKKDQNLSVAFDLGVLFQGNPKTSVSTPSLSSSTVLVGASCGTTVGECLATDNAALYDDAKKLRLWPVASMTVSYGF